jgi:hypothetical protein
MPRCSPAMTTRRLGKVGRMDELRLKKNEEGWPHARLTPTTLM